MTIFPKAARGLGLSLLAVTAAGLMACGGDSDSSSSGAGGGYGSGSGSGTTSKAEPKTTPAPASGGATIALAADERSGLAFDPERLTAKTGRVTLKMANPAGNSAPHAISIEGHGVDQDGNTVAPGGTSSVSLELKAGTYTFYCPVGGHRAAGMEGTLTVR